MDVLAAMRAFVRTVEAGSLSAAARDLGLGQPAVSKQVAALEAHLGAPLAHRSTRSWRLTDEGRRYYERAKRVLEEVEAARAEAARDRATLEGSLRVNAPVGFGELVLTDVVLAFQRRHRRLRVELTLFDRPVDVVKEGVDVALRIGPVGTVDVVARRLGTLPRAFFAAPSYLARRGEPRSLADLAGHDYVRFAWLPSGDRVAAVGPSGPASVRVRGRFLVNNSLAVRRAIEAGAGLGALPAWLAHGPVAAGKLVPVLRDWAPAASPLHALYPPSRYTPERVRAFVAHLRRALARVPGVEAYAPRAPRGGD